MPNLNSLWRYAGAGNGMGDIQRVVLTGHEVATVSESPDPYNIRWSWFGPEEEFKKNFVPFSHVIGQNYPRR